MDNLESLKEEIVVNSDNILKAINLEDLLKDPEGYLGALSNQFLEEHIDEIEKAHKEGVAFAKKVLKKI